MKAIEIKERIMGSKDFCKEVLEVFPILNKEIGVDQHSKYHKRDLFEHSTTVAMLVGMRYKSPHVFIAALLHDIGKLETQEFDAEGYAHYKGHPQKSAEIVEPILKDMHMDPFDIHQILFLIRNHDNQLSPRVTVHGLRKYYRDGGDYESFRDLIDLMRVDAEDHVQSERMKEKIGLLKEYYVRAATIKAIFRRIDYEERCKEE